MSAGVVEARVSMTVQDRLAQLDWKAIEASLWQLGYAKIDSLLASEE